MHDRSVPKLAKWPFLLGDLLLLGVAVGIYHRGVAGLTLSEGVLMAGCVAVGALLAVLPFILEYRAVMKMAESDSLANVVAQIGKLETIGGRIGAATARWQGVQEQADKTAGAAREIAEGMRKQVEGFTEFMQRTNTAEKATLNLEVEKLRRGEGEWLQVVIRMLDHVYALHQGAVRSGQPNVIQQLSSFQHACREVVRRVGVEPFVPVPGEAFNPERHQVLDGDGKPPASAVVSETIATGFTFRNQFLRHALVSVSAAANCDSAVAAVPLTGQPELPLPGAAEK